ncbi:MAG TPA: 16S rRNA (cytidine(1402)-2'-O)-methyltransferase [bacterium]|jgi:16S rRNA (cytidine1402-2'-O)-methyltransferase|nr:MAG: Ribosomal RNA small subunit methyltransferase I [Parcubacteria group bacterium ADurb.Bin115]HNU81414.1 16S rRNA (cytidine(1402)-2'-O)-methyltransferase [bacterium]HOD86806.1 16S rRNA (cytidine(1402)-2'-O)-methyltransferase [bacterium]HPW05426.1 16S rRNA (cytidine(1402)-2'-O)-methyltransferase [bacterium]HPY99376.1 16S rRNA (cytidine(1402)-2'-O)-methyltransferase [bacterium]
MALGTLFVAATPIGNLEDISLRALRILREADYVLCEDTRTTKALLDKYEVKTPTISYHQHSGPGKTAQLLRYLGEGKNLVLVSDAGTPGISDPGSALVASALSEYGGKLTVTPLPGPSALISALSISGWPVDRFTFFGFLPHKKGRQTMLKDLLDSSYPSVFYESKHRLAKCLREIIILKAKTGKRVDMILARELTKMFESIYRGSPEELLGLLEKDVDMQKGEFVVLIRKIK